MKNWTALILLSMILTGCVSAKLVETTLSPKGGTAQYANGGYVHDDSRKLALEKISEFCAGPYKITSEIFNPDVFSLNIGGTYYTNGKDNYMFIKFVCE